MPWTLALRGLIDAPWFEDAEKEGGDDEIDCDNMTDADLKAIQNLGKK